MDRKYIECLDHIISLEETSLTQKKTIEELENEISALGTPHNFAKPELQQAYKPYVPYTVHSESSDSHGYCELFAFIGGVVGAVIGFFMGNIPSVNNFITLLLGAFVVGPILGVVVGHIMAEWDSSSIHESNERARLNAEAESQRIYEDNCRAMQQQYQEELKEYENNLKEDEERVNEELYEKAILIELCNQLKDKHEETKALLNKFYDAADIYITYRNIIAICHITEYLKAGICTELTGHNGAFMVFKYEMYEKQKIERLDTIINQLEQVHFDNQLLNQSLDRIAQNVDCMLDVTIGIQQQQTISAQRNEQLLRGVENQLQMNAAEIRQNNAISVYNQQCINNEIRQVRWLEEYKLFH